MIEEAEVTEAVVFDLDGTLVDTMAAAPGAYPSTIQALGGAAISPDDVVAAWHIGPTPVVLAHFLDRAISPEDIDCFYDHFHTATEHIAPFPGVLELLDTLDRRDYPLGVFTSATRRAATRTLTASGLDRYLPTMVTGDEVDRPKPAADGLHQVCRELGVDPSRAVFVGDSDVDLRCAASAGAVGVHAVWGSAPPRTDQVRTAWRPSDVLGFLA